MLLDDIGAPSSHQVAKTLQVDVDQVQAWRDADCAPRAASLALFWLTRWGQSVVDCEAVNNARLQHQLANAARREADQLRHELVRLLALADFGSANAPMVRPPARLVMIHGRAMQA